MIVDIHSHILPNIDDGSKGIEMTLEMLKNAEENGTKEIVATPHYLLEYGEATIIEVKSLVETVNSVAENNGVDIKVYSGQEVYYNEHILEDYLEGNIGTINDSRYMLIEFPMLAFDENILDILYELQVRNIIPIIAHPERYKPIRENPVIINKFIDAGYLFQINSGSIEGKFGESTRKISKLFLENNIYNFIGSDAHNIKNRNTGLLKSLEILNKEIKPKEKNNELIFEDSSKALLNNNEIKFYGEKIKVKKSIFSFLKF